MANVPPELDVWCERMGLALQNWGRRQFTLSSMLGRDRVEGLTKHGHGDDRGVAFAMLLEIAGELTIGASTLLRERCSQYAASALIRQLIEVEYVLWCFAEDDAESRRWLNADRKELLDVFSPASIRKRSKGLFEADEYHAHCNLGGHPSPSAPLILEGHNWCRPIEHSWCELGLHSMRVWERAVQAAEALSDSGVVAIHVPKLADALAEEVAWPDLTKHELVPDLPVQFEIDLESGKFSASEPETPTEKGMAHHS